LKSELHEIKDTYLVQKILHQKMVWYVNT